MKVNKSIVENRRNDILKYIEENEEIKNNELEELFQISSITVRRDLDYLESIGKIRRFFGGARIVSDDENVNHLIEDKKNRIAEKCAELIEEYDDIFINSSSTAISTLNYIKNKRVSVITNNGQALKMDLDGKINLTLTGGTINYPKNALTGLFATSSLDIVASDVTIIGTSGISDEGYLTTEVLDEVTINRYMIDRATKRVILVCDSSKFGSPANYTTEHISKIDILITDSDIKRETLEFIEKQDVQVILV